jgi:MFS family permease
MTADRVPSASTASTARLPRVYLVWLAGALVSVLGTSLLFFGLGWAAAGHGGAVAGVVLTAVNLPRFVLLLVGGAVGDRFGAWRVMVVGDAVMAGGAVLLAVAAFRFGEPVWLLLVAGLLIGVVDAFYIPASGSLPRRLVGAALLPRAMALRQSGVQLVLFAGGALGGVLVAGVGLGGVALLDAVTFVVVLGVLMSIRGAVAGPVVGGVRSGLGREIGDGLRVAWREPVLRVALVVTSVAAGFLLPVASLLVPLLARAEGWGVRSAGVVVGAHALGIVVAASAIAWRGGSGRPGVASAVGLLIAAAGVGVLALARVAGGPAVAVGGSLLAGVGSGAFSVHIAPLVLGAVRETHLSRLQSLVVMVQSGALLVMNGVLGVLAGELGEVAVVLGLCAVALAVAGGGAWRGFRALAGGGP